MKTDTDTAKATMLTKRPRGCTCCTDTTKILARRAAKRRERQAVARMIRLTY